MGCQSVGREKETSKQKDHEKYVNALEETRGCSAGEFQERGSRQKGVLMPSEKVIFTVAWAIVLKCTWDWHPRARALLPPGKKPRGTGG